MWLRYQATIPRAPDDGDGDGGDPPNQNPKTERELAKARAEAKQYRQERDAAVQDRDHARNEATGLRGRITTLENDFSTYKTEAEANSTRAKAEYDQAIATTKTESDRAVIAAEVRVEAVKAGVHNPSDFVKLVDLSALKRGEDGGVQGLSDLIAQQRKDRAYLFGNGNTSSTAPQPKQPNGQEQPSARNMNADQMSAFEREHGITV